MSGSRRTILINDVDAAGVVFYARAMAIAHEGYELAMAALGISFAEMIRTGAAALPVVRAEADFRRPLRHGDQVRLRVRLAELKSSSYRVVIDLHVEEEGKEGEAATVAVSVTQVHVHLDLTTRRAAALPPALLAALAQLEPHPSLSAPA